MGPGGVLQMQFDADHWDSTISFAPSIPVTLGGVLGLTYAPSVNLAGEIGRTIDLFDWTGVNPTGAFTVISPYTWDLSKLYTTGEVTLIAVPKPSTLLLFSLGFAAVLAMHRVRWSNSAAYAILPPRCSRSSLSPLLHGPTFFSGNTSTRPTRAKASSKAQRSRPAVLASMPWSRIYQAAT